MAVTLTAEQQELRSVVRAFLADRSCEAQVRRLMETDLGYDPATWAQMSEQLGLPGMAVPESHGGGGFTHVDLGVVLEEAGRALLGAPLLSTVLAAETIRACGDEQAAKELLPRIAGGGAVGTVALLEVPGRWAATAVATRAERAGDGWALTGRKVHVLDGAAAALAVVSARAGERVALFAVELPAPGATVQAVPTLDRTRKQAHLTLDATPARLLGDLDGGAAALRRTLAVAAVHLATEQVGGAAAALELAVTYTRTRHQYGRAIGSFQALKHLCADLLTAIEAARSAALAGLLAIDRDDPDLGSTASAAKVFCSETFTAAAAACVQLHGAIGFTWEHPAHLYLKRATSSAALFGTPAAHRERLAADLGLLS